MSKTKQPLVSESEDDLIRDLNKKRGVIRGKFTLFTKYVNSLDKISLTDNILTEL